MKLPAWKQTQPSLVFLMVLCALSLIGCGGGGGGDSEPPPTGSLRVAVTDGESGEALSQATVLLVDGGTGSPLGDLLVTDASGVATVVLPLRSVFVHVSAQAYAPVPPTRAQPVPVQIQKDQTVDVQVELFGLADPASRGKLAGMVKGLSGEGVAGALVVAEVQGESVSGVSSSTGAFVLHNVAPGTAEVTAWKADLNFDSLTEVAVVAGEPTSGLVLPARSAASGSASGSVSFLAVENGTTDITVVHPETGDVIPGLRTYNTDTNTFSLGGVPNGTFHIVASLENDHYVLDPDRVVKFGTPSITVSGGLVNVDFDITDAIPLIAPVDNQDIPLPAQDTDLQFRWAAYPSTSNYVVEVAAEDGEVIWGGFTPEGTQRVSTVATALVFNSDGTATRALEVGRYYQVRVYASKEDQKQPLGYKLISSTEALKGVFRIVPPQ